MSMRHLLLVLLPALVIGSGDDHDDHDDHAGTDEFEWAGIFPTPENYYMWTAQIGKTSLAYADPAMKIVLLPASDDKEATLTTLKAEGNHAMEMNCTNKYAGDTLKPMDDTCYKLNFDANVWQTLFKIDASAASHLAIFAEHFPTEFENDAHYLKNDHGEDVEPVHEIPEAVATEKKKEWGAAIGASILVMICTLIGVVFVVPIFGKIQKDSPKAVMALTNAFAAGALLAAAFYLMLYEATHLIVRSEESYATAEWGSMILTGFITATVLDVVVSTIKGSKQPVAHAPPTKSKTAESPPPSPPSSPSTAIVVDSPPPSPPPSPPADAVTDGTRQVRVLCGIILGDFIHNFADGIFMGIAFSGCDLTLAWTITAATIYHELAQEISDYVVLTNAEQGGLKPAVALGLNFLSGFSVLLGTVIMMASDISMYSAGMLLAFAGGVYVQIGASECMPRVHEYAGTLALKLAALGLFVFGALAIGLVLLDHEHCSPGGGGGDGHDHGGGH